MLHWATNTQIYIILGYYNLHLYYIWQLKHHIYIALGYKNLLLLTFSLHYTTKTHILHLKLLTTTKSSCKS